MSNILHITNWYPNLWNAHETPFIKAYFDAVAPHGRHQLCHVQVRSCGSLFRIFRGNYADGQSYLILDTRIKVWRLIELLHVALLAWLRISQGRRWWDGVNVHIAYPLLRYPKLFGLLFGKNILISEHWSAYRQGFHLPLASPARGRIQNIFHCKIPVVAVSNALMNDIVRFAKAEDFSRYIVPNSVDPGLFYLKDKPSGRAPVFLMVASWAPVKRPLLVMRAFRDILTLCPAAQLRIIGSGTQWQEMKDYVATEKLEDSILLPGAMEKARIAEQMRDADFFLHASSYETFSVVCAEALCCGVPVIASNVGAIPELVNDSNGLLVENSHQEWVAALQFALSGKARWNAGEIADKAILLFGSDVIGKQLESVFLNEFKIGTAR